MIVVFAHTGGLVGAEIGVAGGTAVLAQRILEAVFGDQAVRRLAETAKDELDSRVQALLSGELVRYHAVLDGLGADPALADRLRTLSRSVEEERLALPGPGSGAVDRALPGTAGRPALERPEVRQLPAGLAGGPVVDDIVDAELVEPASVQPASVQPASVEPGLAEPAPKRPEERR
jgi:hypothetical protein